MIFVTIKFISRLTHILTATSFGGLTILNFLFGEVIKESTLSDPVKYSQYAKFCAITGTLMIISGTLNIFLIKGKKKVHPKYHLWYLLILLKFIIGLSATPMFYSVSEIFGYKFKIVS